jgi:anti-sigma B factor antagonist
MLDIELDRDSGDFSICRPIGELDASTVCQFRQMLAELASSPRLVIDMSGVVFIDSAGLGALIGGIRRTREWGGDVVLACGRPSLNRLLLVTGIDRIVTITDTVEQAVLAFVPVIRPARRAPAPCSVDVPRRAALVPPAAVAVR